jgi:hypothetical protein
MAYSDIPTEKLIGDSEVKLKKVFNICTRCNGTGIYSLPMGDVPCERCETLGIIQTGWIEV